MIIYKRSGCRGQWRVCLNWHRENGETDPPRKRITEERRPSLPSFPLTGRILSSPFHSRCVIPHSSGIPIRLFQFCVTISSGTRPRAKLKCALLSRLVSCCLPSFLRVHSPRSRLLRLPLPLATPRRIIRRTTLTPKNLTSMTSCKPRFASSPTARATGISSFASVSNPSPPCTSLAFSFTPFLLNSNRSKSFTLTFASPTAQSSKIIQRLTGSKSMTGF